MTLADAARELDRRPPPRMDPVTHPLSYRLVGELLDARERQREDAEPAA